MTDMADSAVVAGLRLVVEMHRTGDDESKGEETQEGGDPVEATLAGHTRSSWLNTPRAVRSQAMARGEGLPGRGATTTFGSGTGELRSTS
jgi:hypothetical protein